ncbi:MAG: DUF4276 family protein [Spirulinaceae cyanobacterium]
MVRLYLFAEGQTEQTFAKRVLCLHLALKNVFLQHTLLIAKARRKGQVHRGGGSRYQPMKNDIERFLKQEKGNDVFFTTMIDRYALHADFPGLKESEKLSADPYQQVRFLERKFLEDIDDQRFIPHLQLHEYEAYLFTAPEYFSWSYNDCEQQVESLRDIAARYDSPELIDDNIETAPSKRILKVFPQYKKSVDGPQIAEAIGLAEIRNQCPHFNNWLSQLESLAE